MLLTANLYLPSSPAPLVLSPSHILRYRVEDSLSDGPPLGAASSKRFELLLSADALPDCPDLENARVEVFTGEGRPFGVWYVYSALRAEGASTLALLGADALGTRFEARFADAASAYPRTLGSLVQTLCAAAGTALHDADFFSASLRIPRLPAWDDDCTLRRALSHAAFLAGGFVRVDWDGSARLVPAFGTDARPLSAESCVSASHADASFRFNALSYRHTGAKTFTRYAVDPALPETALNTLRAEGNPLAMAANLSALAAHLDGGSYGAGELTFFTDDPPLAGDVLVFTDSGGQTRRLLVTRLRLTADVRGVKCELESAVPSPLLTPRSNAVFAADGSVRFEAIGEVSQKVLALSEAYISSLNAGDIRANGLSAKMVEALRLSAREISAGDMATDSLTACLAEIVNASVRKLEAGTIAADEFTTALFNAFSVKAESVTASQLSTDRLAAALARVCVLAAGSAEFDRATVVHLVANALSLSFGTADEVFINNLAVSYASLLAANVNDLRVRAADGAYYCLLVDPETAAVTAEPCAVTAAEAQNAQTADGHPILETSIAARDLSASNVKSLYALISRLDAARVDVDSLFARSAFVDRLNTQDITANTHLRIALEALESAQAAAARGIGEADRRLSDVEALAEDIRRFLLFDADGLKQGKSGSVYSTLINESGFHILRRGSVAPVGSFDQSGLTADGLTLGAIRARRTVRGGWVWEELGVRS